MSLKGWLERRSVADLGAGAKFNPNHATSRDPSGDNLYLHHINLKLAHTNTLLESIRNLLIWITVLLTAICGRQLGWL